jgi:hypothetical protein
VPTLTEARENEHGLLFSVYVAGHEKRVYERWRLA